MGETDAAGMVPASPGAGRATVLGKPGCRRGVVPANLGVGKLLGRQTAVSPSLDTGKSLGRQTAVSPSLDTGKSLGRQAAATTSCCAGEPRRPVPARSRLPGLKYETFGDLEDIGEADAGQNGAGKARCQGFVPGRLPEPCGADGDTKGDGELDEGEAGEIGDEGCRLGADHGCAIGPAVKQSGQGNKRGDDKGFDGSAIHDGSAYAYDRGRDDELGKGKRDIAKDKECAGDGCRNERRRGDEAVGLEGGDEADAYDKGKMIKADHGMAEAGEKPVP